MNIKWHYSKLCVEDGFSVRRQVFVQEQGFSEELEFDNIDAVAHHVVVYDDEIPVGTARLFGEGSCLHVGRVCVIKAYRGKGIGDIIMEAMRVKAIELGATSLELSSQVTAMGFYRKHGYVADGEEYMDEHCPHIMMRVGLVE